ncbi:hypothetical protein [uncultured Aquimarina sp.]|uniref:hypothetical protein n=1 Tax=uncultured Aquimarina sp. TaxID=575652 RepID=UPI00262C9022|nr:hypothetical protein [uncultured Aquimarina sp.]
MKRVIFVLFIFSLVNCSNDESLNPINNEVVIDNYYFRYMQYPQGVLNNSQLDNLVNIIYDEQNRIIKRVGGLLYISPTSGFDYTFSKEIFDSISQNSNRILIERKTTSLNYQIAKFKRTLFLNQQGKITSKIVETTFPTTQDTIDYQYNSIGKIMKTTSRNQFNPRESVFYYNSNGNLDSIVSLEYNRNQLSKKTLEVFSNYDNSINLVKNLNIFEETFYRSLTENNYSEYEKKVFNSNNDLVSEEKKTWNFIYDDNGTILFDVF